MATPPPPLLHLHLQSRDAVTTATRGDTRALRDFFRETEPPLPPPPPPARVAVARGPQRSASLGGLLGLFRSDKKAKAKAKEKEKEKEKEEKGLRIDTPPPGTVAITRNSGHTVYMIGQPAAPLLPPPTLLPQPEQHESLPRPRRSPRVEREEYLARKSAAQCAAPRPRSRMGLGLEPHAGIGIGMMLANGSFSSESEPGLLDALDASGSGRALVNNGAEQHAQTNDPARQAHLRACSTASGGTGASRASSDRNEHAQPPPYNEATERERERISIFIDGEALQAMQGSSEGFSAGLLEKIRAERGQYHVQGALPNTYYPAPRTQTQASRRPLPPVPTTAHPESRRPEESVRSGYAHHRRSVIIPVHQSISTPRWNEDVHRWNEDVHLPLAPPQQQQQPCNIGARTDRKLCASQAPPRDYIGPIAPSRPARFDTTAEESLHVDELDVAERKPPSKLEKAILRRIEFGLKVDYSILQLT